MPRGTKGTTSTAPLRGMDARVHSDVDGGHGYRGHGAGCGFDCAQGPAEREDRSVVFGVGVQVEQVVPTG